MSDASDQETMAGLDAPPRAASPRGSAAVRGDEIGRYVVLSRVGVGGMGAVYAAYDPELDRKVALKLLHATHTGLDTAGYQHLLHEARAMAKLSHPNVVAVHDVGEHEGRVFLAMEFVVGQTLTAWIAERKRAWPQLVDMFVSAGRGLAAAHDEGLVHRDFKPDNVLVGDDGRVRVTDFGIAEASHPGTTGRDAQIPKARPLALDTRPTWKGIVGTPVYMAPEQHRGETVGPAADQFSFCVALWEALFGERPFPSTTLPELMMAVTEGERRAPPRGAAVPGWLRRLCERGLARDPDERLASMHVLLAALARGRTRSRRQKAFVGVAVLAALGGGAELFRQHQASRAQAECDDLGDRIEEVWHPARRAALREAIESSNAPYAAQSADKAMPWLDDYATQWAAARTEACVHSSIEHAWEQPIYEQAVWCLEEEQWAFDALVERLSTGDVSAANAAVSAASGLTPTGECLDTARLSHMPTPPTERAEAVQAIRNQLARSRAVAPVDARDEGLPIAQQALHEAERLEWPPLIAACQHRIGEIHEAAGAYPEAEALQEEAFFTAAEAGANDVAFRALLSLVIVVGYRQGRHVEGLRWARLASVRLATMSDPTEFRAADRLKNEGIVAWAAGQNTRARELLLRSLEIHERHLGPHHPLVAGALGNLAAVSMSMREPETARPLLERALAIQEATLGPSHPRVAGALNNVATVRESAYELEAARAGYLRALELKTGVLGANHPDVARARVNLANVDRALGRLDLARPGYLRAMTIQAQVLGPQSADLARTATNFAELEVTIGSPLLARALATRAIEIWDQREGAEPQRLAASVASLGDVELRYGNGAAAVALYQRARELHQDLDEEHDPTVRLDARLARALLTSGRTIEALAAAEAAVGNIDARTIPPVRGEAHFVLAQALWELGEDRARARAIGRAALSDYAAAAGLHAGDRARAQAWVEAHR